jgi:hypothetical protein
MEESMKESFSAETSTETVLSLTPMGNHGMVSGAMEGESSGCN